MRISFAITAALLLVSGCVREPERVSSVAPSPAAVRPPPLPLPPPRERLATVACRWHADHLPAEVVEDPAALKAGTTWVAATQDGSPSAAIEASVPPDDSILLRLQILETRGTRSRVAFPGYGGILVGWIDRDRLRFVRNTSIDLSHDCAAILVRQPDPRPDDVVCPRELPLVPELHGERHLVGTVRAGVRVHAEAASAGWSAVDFPEALLAAAAPASFLVRSADLASCQPAPASRK